MKNFVKLIQRVREERFSAVMEKIVTQKIPVTFLSLAPVAQAVELTKNLRAQNLNVTRLIVIDSTSPPADIDFEVVHVNDAAQIYPQPEYVFVNDNFDAIFAIKFMCASKIIFPLEIRGKKPEEVYEFFMAHLDDLWNVYASLIDEQSKKTFRGYWFSCISSQINSVVYAAAPHYFLAGFTPKPKDIFIDCGSYTGWTAAQFAKLGCEVYSFEMNATNFVTASETAAKYNFTVENLGLGSYPHDAHYINTRGASRLDSAGEDVAKIITLDDYVREKNLPRVDFIKMDVEGSELDVLKGATISITTWKPVLALSAYHKLDDLWTLMNFVKSLRPDYEFALRQYATDYASSPHFFNDNHKEIFGLFDVDLKTLTYDECVLFAR